MTKQSLKSMLGGISLSFIVAAPVAAQTTIQADVWADNWFAMYQEKTLLKEDSVSINTERSFNAESFTFKADLPAQINVIVKDFKQNDTGLEYIGTRKQQMGDGGFIAQFIDQDTGKVLAVTNQQWKCTAIHIAPLNKSCAKSASPQSSCKTKQVAADKQWQAVDFNDSHWPAAVEYTERVVRPKDGYDRIRWAAAAKLIWTQDLEADNTLLCRVTLKAS
ncbi:MAG: hypothetical protein OFPI_03910 [Osedax symbiont Rs2]|nr:MAG: hypothetical protein OFPI_03910 [Osedax symbiont Rs2]